MSNSRIDANRTNANVQVETTRTRQTEAPSTPFRNILAGGANAIMTGAEVATGAIGGPVLAAAVREARTDVVASIDGSRAGGDGSAASAATSPPGSDMAAMHAMQRESQSFNLQLLKLQEDVQNENRRFTTVSNVARAKHDTAMGAVKNIH